MLNRRSFVATSAGLVAATPFRARGQRPGDPRVLRFVPQANLTSLDPIWTTAAVTANHGYYVYDTLYGMDDALNVRPQMADTHTVEDDGRTWLIRLREGLRFHDGEPVRAQDCAPSLERWSRRDTFGQSVAPVVEEWGWKDDRTIRIRLKRPFPLLLQALGKPTAVIPFIMPERIARTDPFSAIRETVGSGPYRFIADEYVSGSRVVYRKFDGYVPRREPAERTAGGKVAHFERIEWTIIPDSATASAALQNGEIDWWETPLPDLVPILKRNRNIMVDIADPLGNIGSFRLNHLHPPFSDVRARRAIQMALNQEDYMRAIVGSDDALWRRLPSFFTPGTPAYTEAGGDVLKGPRDIEGAKRLLKEAGYDGQPITVLVAQDQAPLKAMGEVTNALLRSLGMNVDFVATDWGTVGQRRAMKTPPGSGGWHIFHTWHAGADCIAPASYNAIRGNGERAWFGWPTSEKTEAAVEKWLAAATPEQEKAAYDEINAAAMADVVYVPTGFYLGYQAWRRNVTGIQKGPLPFFWDVKKA